jgi:hypothetical protein
VGMIDPTDTSCVYPRCGCLSYKRDVISWNSWEICECGHPIEEHEHHVFMVEDVQTRLV